MGFVARGPQAPCAGQSAAAIEAWLRANAGKDVHVVVRYAAGNRLRYQLGWIVGVDAGVIKVAVRHASGYRYPLRGGFYFDGRSCWIPGLLRHLVIPTPEVLAACQTCEDKGCPPA